jgi:hypothetical protein
MSSPINAQLTGTFTSDGTAVNLSLPSGYTEIELTNLTDIGSTAASTPVMKSWGYSSMTNGYGIYATKTNGAATIAIPTTTTSNGFTFVSDSGLQTPGAALDIDTGISQATQAVVTTTVTTGLANNDIVRIYGTTGMLQIAGMDFTISNLSAGSSYRLAYLDSSGFAAAATAGTARRIPFDARYYPVNRYITKVTSSGTSSIITLSVTHGFTAGQAVRFVVPDEFGMTQLDGLIGNITAVGASDGVVTNTITVDIDSSAFTAFAFPTSAISAAGVNFAQVVPVGMTATGTYANNLDDATYNEAFRGVIVGTSMQTTAKEYQWVARKGTSI